jgi:hypothetical protein
MIMKPTIQEVALVKEEFKQGDVVRMVNGRALRLDVNKLIANADEQVLLACLSDEDEERAERRAAYHKAKAV